MKMNQCIRVIFAGCCSRRRLRRGADDPRAVASQRRHATEALARALAESWPDRPEWLDMYTDILAGEPARPERRLVPPRPSRRPGSAGTPTRKRFDRDGDGKIARSEFPGSDADFARLDRDHDRALTAADFDFSRACPDPLARHDALHAHRPRRQRQGHARGVRRLLQADRRRQPGLPLALRPSGGLPHANVPAGRRGGDGRRGPRRRR